MDKGDQIVYDMQQQMLNSLANSCKRLNVQPEHVTDWNEDKRRPISEVINTNQDKIFRMILRIEKAVYYLFPDKTEQIVVINNALPMDSLPIEIVIHIISKFESPIDVINFGITCKKYNIASKDNKIWSALYKLKFPIFWETIEHSRQTKENVLQIISKGQKSQRVESSQKPEWQPPHQLIAPWLNQSWLKIYQDTLEGKLSVIVQVYNRECIIGFYRSYFDGIATYLKAPNTFKVEYFPHLREKHIPKVEHVDYALHKLRMRPTPLDVRYNNPYLVFEANREVSFQIGDPVELQWRRNIDGAFAWWYGVVTNKNIEPTGITVGVIFTQFPTSSPWHLLTLPEHLDYAMPLACGGYLGGIRKVEGRDLIEMKAHLANEPRFY